MGAFCSCLQVDYSDHHGNNSSSAFRNCVCLRCFTQQLINAYTVLFRVGAVHPVSPAIEATPVDTSESSFDTYRSPPRPLPYDDPRFSPPSRDWFALRREASSHSPEESEPLRPDDDDEEMETPITVDKPSKTNYDTKMKRSTSAYGEKVPPKDLGNYFTYFSPSAEDEDVCPTCLEDYTSENPRIVMQCTHHFHLGCIYEWMERSEACPVCGKAGGYIMPRDASIELRKVLANLVHYLVPCIPAKSTTEPASKRAIRREQTHPPVSRPYNLHPWPKTRASTAGGRDNLVSHINDPPPVSSPSDQAFVSLTSFDMGDITKQLADLQQYMNKKFEEIAAQMKLQTQQQASIRNEVKDIQNQLAAHNGAISRLENSGSSKQKVDADGKPIADREKAEDSEPPKKPEDFTEKPSGKPRRGGGGSGGGVDSDDDEVDGSGGHGGRRNRPRHGGNTEDDRRDRRAPPENGV